ncbi:N-acetylglucosamine-1-phosphotransferase subunit gamma isoform X2 [Aplysia californica]|nr:N-acetylglucosamine-1-phosphotransferase subunit gamma isoform X2 [Aplysia californica]
MVNMKIVEEPSSFGINYPYGQGGAAQESTLKLRVQPANFSGPPHFRRLVGRCFNSIIADYKYNFCPFSNITQHEQGVHWNPYNGVLGVWQEWEVENNTFVAMLMKDGDSCGTDLFRSVKVSFECGNASKIVDVSEPVKCNYHLVFKSPLVCHADAMLVYPTLDPELQEAWDQLEGEAARGELTDKGYKKRLRKILEKAGLLMTQESHKSLVQKAEEVKQEQVKEGEFESLDSCKAEFKKLQNQVKSLMSQLGLGGSQNAVTDADQAT